MSDVHCRVLAVGAHPDDIELGCGGTLLRFAQCGAEVYMLVLSDGGRGALNEVRRQEQINAANVLGAAGVFFAAQEDTRLAEAAEEVRRHVQGAIERVRPRYVLVHAASDTHQDHRCAHDATVIAARQVDNLWFYESPSTTAFDGRIFVDISDTLEQKVQSVLCHDSQMNRALWKPRSARANVEILAAYRGRQLGTLYAESFIAHRAHFRPSRIDVTATVGKHSRAASVREGALAPPLKTAPVAVGDRHWQPRVVSEAEEQR